VALLLGLGNSFRCGCLSVENSRLKTSWCSVSSAQLCRRIHWSSCAGGRSGPGLQVVDLVDLGTELGLEANLEMACGTVSLLIVTHLGSDLGRVTLCIELGLV